jgi:hypothetical protein
MPCDLRFKAMGGAVVCSHVLDGKPALFMARDRSLLPIDSGWQITCGDAGDHTTIDSGKCICLGCVVDMLPSVAALLDTKAPAAYERSDENDPWTPIGRTEEPGVH